MIGNNKGERLCIFCDKYKKINQFKNDHWHKSLCLVCWQGKSGDEIREKEDKFDFRYFYKMFPQSLPVEEATEYFSNRSPSPIDFDNLIDEVETELEKQRKIKTRRESLNITDGMEKLNKEIKRLEKKFSELLGHETQYQAQIQIGLRKK